MNALATQPAAKPAKSAYRALPPMLRRFVDAYLIGDRPTDIIRKLRPDIECPYSTASRWLKRPEVKAAIAERGEDLVQSVGITHQMIVREMARIAFGDPRKLVDEHGRIKGLHELDEDAAAMVAGLEIEDLFEGKGELQKHIGRLHKIKRWDKRQALNDLAEIAGIKKSDDAPRAVMGPGLTVVVQQNLAPGSSAGPQQTAVVVNLPPPA